MLELSQKFIALDEKIKQNDVMDILDLKRDKRYTHLLTINISLRNMCFFFHFQEEELGSQVLSLLRDRIAVSRSGEPAGSS